MSQRSIRFLRPAALTYLAIGQLLQIGGCHGAGRTTDSDLPGADIRVDGIDCPYCVYNVERAVGRVDGVSSVSFNQRAGHGRATFSPGGVVTADRLRQAVVDSGFTPRRVRMRVGTDVAPGKQRAVHPRDDRSYLTRAQR